MVKGTAMAMALLIACAHAISFVGLILTPSSNNPFLFLNIFSDYTVAINTIFALENSKFVLHQNLYCF